MISICIATCNGEEYIKEQICSILEQISLTDEIIICDDASTDGTISIINECNDSRIQVYNNKLRLGHVKNFEKALSLAHGDYIFLSDQDDVWIPGRVEKMLNLIQNDRDVLLVAGNFDLIDRNGVAVGEFRKLNRASRFKTVQIFEILSGQAPYYGCTFLLRKEILGYCLPIPDNVESHDIWIALIANYFGKVINIFESTLQHRMHDKNVTTKRRRSLIKILISRWNFLSSLIIRIFKLKLKPPIKIR